MNIEQPVVGRQYIFIVMANPTFAASESFQTLVIGTFNGIKKQGEITIVQVKNPRKWNGVYDQLTRTFALPPSFIIKAVNVPTTDREYTNFVKGVEKYQRKVTYNNDEERNIVETVVTKLKEGENPFHIIGSDGIRLKYLTDTEVSSTIGKRQIDKEDTKETIVEETKKDDCPVCLEKLDNNTVTTECGHKFHEECIINVMRKSSNKCPICRKPIDRSNPYIQTPVIGGKRLKRKRKTSKPKKNKRKTKRKYKCK